MNADNQQVRFDKSDLEEIAKCYECKREVVAVKFKEAKKIPHVTPENVQTYTHYCPNCKYEGIIVDINKINTLISPSELY